MTAPGDAKTDLRTAFFIDRNRRRETAEKLLSDLQKFLYGSGHRFRHCLGERCNKRGFIVRWPKIDICGDSLLLW